MKYLKYFKLLLCNILLLHFSLLVSSSVFAADFRTSYTVEYFIQEDDLQGYTKAAYTIAITNLQPDLVIKKFTLSFPKSFGIGSMSAKDDSGTINAITVEKERSAEVTFELSSPKGGLNEVNTLYLDFLQKNIFRSKGAVWEVFIPTLENKEGDTHSISVYLPPGKHKKLSLAKPAPSHVSFDKVAWTGNTGKSIYAVFGDEQRYSLDLSYHLVNPNAFPVYTDIAFPPDTVYQKVIVTSIIPPPNLVYSDSDGNYMARYSLKAHQEQLVQFKGVASIYTTPRSDFKNYARGQFDQQQKNLFNLQPLWNLEAETPIQSSLMKDHYDYTLKKLDYNFNRKIKGNSRMGAKQAALYPDQAVCTEYSDLLIASARQRGIYIREVQGFAFASEQELRPIQQESDILHSWVEYYDPKKGFWIPLDPTWEDTSSIDYFNSFDFNHIVFALHGKKADYPYPAGSYKSAPGGQDIKIQPTTSVITEIKKLSGRFSSLIIPDEGSSFVLDFYLKNEGNVAQWDIPLSFQAQNASVDFSNQKIAHLLPGEERKIAMKFTPHSSFLYQSVHFTAISGERILLIQTVQVPTILSSLKTYIFPILLVGGGIITLLVLLKKKGEQT